MNKEDLREAITTALVPLSERVKSMGEKLDDVRSAQDKMYSREMVDQKLKELKDDISDIRATLPQVGAAIALLLGIIQLLQHIKF